ncbi:uncharacterized protein LOC123302817 [Chrysoperla carnea]|uniref:uncharacterized protein LOC123302817 n=1 Tax=Chrysoperla carnea TaxID=189513 RepID=UPI001D09449C|nr:uncharacterized protein LOC123302817 [Chrysoperla carnea]
MKDYNSVVNTGEMSKYLIPTKTHNFTKMSLKNYQCFNNDMIIKKITTSNNYTRRHNLFKVNLQLRRYGVGQKEIITVKHRTLKILATTTGYRPIHNPKTQTTPAVDGMSRYN